MKNVKNLVLFEPEGRSSLMIIVDKMTTDQSNRCDQTFIRGCCCLCDLLYILLLLQDRAALRKSTIVNVTIHAMRRPSVLWWGITDRPVTAQIPVKKVGAVRIMCSPAGALMCVLTVESVWMDPVLCVPAVRNATLVSDPHCQCYPFIMRHSLLWDLLLGSGPLWRLRITKTFFLPQIIIFFH